MSKTVAIHQPNFFPWLGFFDKLVRADVLILMDNVQFPKTGGTWANRVRMLISGKSTWGTMPIVRNYHGLKLIKDMEINETTDWRKKFFDTIRMNYSRAAFFNQIIEFVRELIFFDSKFVSEYNVHAITKIAKLFGCENKLVIGSTLNVENSSTDLLISMTKAVGGDAYMCGGGAAGYQQDDKFKEAGLELVYQNFAHPTYKQCGGNEFVPGLSIIDALMNVGIDGLKNLLQG